MHKGYHGEFRFQLGVDSELEIAAVTPAESRSHAILRNDGRRNHHIAQQLGARVDIQQVATDQSSSRAGIPVGGAGHRIHERLKLGFVDAGLAVIDDIHGNVVLLHLFGKPDEILLVLVDGASNENNDALPLVLVLAMLQRQLGLGQPNKLQIPYLSHLNAGCKVGIATDCHAVDGIQDFTLI